jgi:hypothetical protein
MAERDRVRKSRPARWVRIIDMVGVELGGRPALIAVVSSGGLTPPEPLM